MKTKYNCPVCGKVPKVSLSYIANKISCCNITVMDQSETKRCVKKWKKIVRLFKKEYKIDPHGLPIVDLNIPMPDVKPIERCICIAGTAKDGTCCNCGKNRD